MSTLSESMMHFQVLSIAVSTVYLGLDHVEGGGAHANAERKARNFAEDFCENKASLLEKIVFDDERAKNHISDNWESKIVPAIKKFTDEQVQSINIDAPKKVIFYPFLVNLFFLISAIILDIFHDQAIIELCKIYHLVEFTILLVSSWLLFFSAKFAGEINKKIVDFEHNFKEQFEEYKNAALGKVILEFMQGFSR